MSILKQQINQPQNIKNNQNNPKNAIVKTKSISKINLRSKAKEFIKYRKKNIYCVLEKSQPSVVHNITADHFKDTTICKQFDCAICMQIMVYPCILQCGHTFCLQCIETAHATDQKCCLCRRVLDAAVFCCSSSLQLLIDNYCQGLDSKKLQDYRNRKETFKQKDRSRRLQEPCTVGTKCDFRLIGNGSRWEQGIVIRVYSQYNQKFVIVKPINREGLRYTFSLVSRNIARFKLYTQNAVQAGQTVQDSQSSQWSEDSQSSPSVEEEYEYTEEQAWYLRRASVINQMTNISWQGRTSLLIQAYAQKIRMQTLRGLRNYRQQVQ